MQAKGDFPVENSEKPKEKEVKEEKKEEKKEEMKEDEEEAPAAKKRKVE